MLVSPSGSGTDPSEMTKAQRQFEKRKDSKNPFLKKSYIRQMKYMEDQKARKVSQLGEKLLDEEDARMQKN
eukprot:CAMPEP_0170499760 /NCGR_PEP_ID=MMETSP0208-20121228/32475_1 /TAXON_ID=197538 /ORGANISM="Strombidium inclinatum, Strain S3" /LENGTH=70 /DNA_ID=CAMNT_0010777459 /DNA_START=1210 /DNA_END=1422 /DNA_ORIENTATION=-